MQPTRVVAVLAVLISTPLALAAQTFSQSVTFCSAAEHTTSIALGDIDGDRDLDIVFGNGRHLAETDWLFYNNGRGDFYGRRPLDNEPDRSYGVALADLNGDGALDLVVANDLGNRSALYFNDGKGAFTFLRGLGSGREGRRAVALGDLNGDGRNDVVLVGPGQDHIYINQVTGEWTEQALGAGADQTLAVALADVDGDRDLDVIVANRFEAPNLIYLNDGRGGFTESRVFGNAADDAVSVAAGDIDRDGDVDLVAGRWEQATAVYLNDGRGVFSEGQPFGSGRQQTWTVVLGDMDLDGDLDAVIGVRGVTTVQIDADGDGRPDRWVDQNRDDPSRIYLNDGSGRFSPGSPFGHGNNMTRPVAVGDVDNDGDLDIVMGNDCQPNAIFFNSLRGPRR